MFELIKSISIDPISGVAQGKAVVPANHPLFVDHFPGRPLLAGTLLIEMAAQVAGPLAEEVTKHRLNLDRWALLGMIREAKFLHPVSLPASIDFGARAERLESSNITISVRADVDEQLVMRTQLVMMMTEAGQDWSEAIAARETRLAKWKSGKGAA